MVHECPTCFVSLLEIARTGSEDALLLDFWKAWDCRVKSHIHVEKSTGQQRHTGGNICAAARWKDLQIIVYQGNCVIYA